MGFVLEECRRSNIEVKEVKMTHIQTNAWKDSTRKIWSEPVWNFVDKSSNPILKIIDQYPKDITDAYNILVNYKKTDQLKRHRRKIRDSNSANWESSIDVDDDGDGIILT